MTSLQNYRTSLLAKASNQEHFLIYALFFSNFFIRCLPFTLLSIDWFGSFLSLVPIVLFLDIINTIIYKYHKADKINLVKPYLVTLFQALMICIALKDIYIESVDLEEIIQSPSLFLAILVYMVIPVYVAAAFLMFVYAFSLVI